MELPLSPKQIKYRFKKCNAPPQPPNLFLQPGLIQAQDRKSAAKRVMLSVVSKSWLFPVRLLKESSCASKPKRLFILPTVNSSGKQYVSNIGQLDKVRQEWESTHINSCEVQVESRAESTLWAQVWKCTGLDQCWQYPRPVGSLRMYNTSYELSLKWVTHRAKCCINLHCGPFEIPFISLSHL